MDPPCKSCAERSPKGFQPGARPWPGYFCYLLRSVVVFTAAWTNSCQRPRSQFFAMLLNLSRVIPVEGFWHHMARYGTVRLFLALAGWLKGCRTQQFHIALGTQVLTKLWNTGWAFDRGNLRWTWSWGWCGCCRILQGCATDVGIFRGHLQPGALCSWCRSYNLQDLCFAS